MGRRLRYLLLQTRNTDDPMAPQEVRCFARALGCDLEAIDVFDLLSGAPARENNSFPRSAWERTSLTLRVEVRLNANRYTRQSILLLLHSFEVSVPGTTP